MIRERGDNDRGEALGRQRRLKGFEQTKEATAMVEEIKKFNQDENDDDFIFLCEDEVSNGKPEEGFIPTHDELIALVKYWSLEILESRWLFDFIYPTAGSDIQAERVFANRRINRIRTIVGDEKVDKACKEVRNDFRKGISNDLWAVFDHGDTAQWAAVEEEMGAILNRDKKRLASLSYLDYPESPSPGRSSCVALRVHI
jgi:hypothetical protein